MAQKLSSRELKRLEATAYHEAGHAVTGYLLGRRITSVSVIPDDTTLGRCHYASTKFNPDIREYTNRRIRNFFETNIMIYMAGFQAQRLFTGRSERRSGPDVTGVHENLAQLVGHGKDLTIVYDDKLLKAYFNWLMERTRVLLQDSPHNYHWAAVQALARALVQERQIGGRKAKEVIEETSEAWVQAKLGNQPPVVWPPRSGSSSGFPDGQQEPREILGS